MKDPNETNNEEKQVEQEVAATATAALTEENEGAGALVD
jgi:hypothetical protein